MSHDSVFGRPKTRNLTQNTFLLVVYHILPRLQKWSSSSLKKPETSRVFVCHTILSRLSFSCTRLSLHFSLHSAQKSPHFEVSFNRNISCSGTTPHIFQLIQKTHEVAALPDQRTVVGNKVFL